MGISVFPPASAASVLETKAVSVPAASVGYRLSTSFPASTYTITCPATVVATVTFEDSAGAIGRTSTSSGSVQLSLSRDADKALIYTNAGTSVIVTITPSGRSLSPVATGAATEYNTTTTLSTTGAAYSIIVGGGGGGSGAGSYPGGAGGAGGISAGYTPISSNASIVIGGGAGGAGPSAGFGGGNASGGGTSTISGTGITTLTANGGGGGHYSLHNGAQGGGGGTGNAVNGGSGGPHGYGTGGGTSYNSGEFIFVKSGTISTGGAWGTNAGAGLKGGGGAAGGNGPTGNGGDGGAGVAYVLEV
jgi:hypothetical protein